MSRRGWRWLLLGALAYLFFLVWHFPAALMVSRVQKRLPVSLDAVSGSLWSGEAAQMSVRGQPWGVVRWRFDWLAPLHASLGYYLILDGPDTRLQGRVDAGVGGRVVLRNLSGEIQVAQLGPWLPLPQPPQGKLAIQLSEARLVQGRLQSATGALTLTGATLQWPETLSLGDYRLTLTTSAVGHIQGVLSDTGNGPLNLQGQITLTPGRYEAQGQVQARSSASQDLKRWLNALGPVNAQGAEPWQFSGSY